MNETTGEHQWRDDYRRRRVITNDDRFGVVRKIGLNPDIDKSIEIETAWSVVDWDDHSY